VAVKTAEREYCVRETLRSLLARVDPEDFVQIHRSVVVNREHVRRSLKSGGHCVAAQLTDGSVYRVGRRYRHLAKRLL